MNAYDRGDQIGPVQKRDHLLDSSASCTDPDFSLNASRAHCRVGAAWCAAAPPREAEQLIADLRRQVVSQILENTGQLTLAGWAGDDFDFILRAAYLRLRDPWITALWDTYESGVNPHADSEFVPPPPDSFKNPSRNFFRS